MILLLVFGPRLPHPIMSDGAPPMHASWWTNHRPLEGNGRFRRPPHHGHLHHEGLAPPAWSPETWRLSQSELKDLVAGAKGFYVRDWSVGLGWNNVSTLWYTDRLTVCWY